MFCFKCGKSIPDNSVFCNTCGVNVATPQATETTPTPVSPQNVAPQQPQTYYTYPPQPYSYPPLNQAAYSHNGLYTPPEFGNVLLASNGSFSSTAAKVLIFWIAQLILSFILAFWLGVDTYQINDRLFSDIVFTEYNFWFYFWIVFALADITLGTISIITVCTTKLLVLENGVVGKAAYRVRFFFWGFLYPKKESFSLAYDRIKCYEEKDKLFICSNTANLGSFLIFTETNPLVYSQLIKKQQGNVKEVKPIVSTISDSLGYIYCPSCNTKQKNDRMYCFKCNKVLV